MKEMETETEEERKRRTTTTTTTRTAATAATATATAAAAATTIEPDRVLSRRDSLVGRATDWRLGSSSRRRLGCDDEERSIQPDTKRLVGPRQLFSTRNLRHCALAV